MSRRSGCTHEVGKTDSEAELALTTLREYIPLPISQKMRGICPIFGEKIFKSGNFKHELTNLCYSKWVRKDSKTVIKYRFYFTKLGVYRIMEEQKC